MAQALVLARRAVEAGEVPIGAVIVRDGEIVGRGWNRNISLKDPSAHAEIMAMREAGKTLGNHRLPGCSLYVTLEPCPMCAGAIVQARIPHVVYGASDPKAGAVGSLFQLLGDSRLNHQAHVTPHVMADPCGQILTQFFQRQRALGKK